VANQRKFIDMCTSLAFTDLCDPILTHCLKSVHLKPFLPSEPLQSCCRSCTIRWM